MRLDLSLLNPQQLEAVEYGEGPLLVLAGAGTGKTRVITYRMAHLMARRNVPGDRILGFTFTNKAAREMRDRLNRMYPDLDPSPLVSTFHSFGLQFLREEYKSYGIRSRFPIYDDSDTRSVLTEILREIGGLTQAEKDVDGIRRQISRWKMNFISPEKALDGSVDDTEELQARAYLRYKDRMKGFNAVDFDDLIHLPVLLLESDSEVRDRWQKRFDHLLIDEYQDTNSAQYRFARALVDQRENLCVVGDDDQSIYAFRGAEVEKILFFNKDFPKAHVVTLEKNYRSVASILEPANAVISKNPKRHPKKLVSMRGAGETIRFSSYDGDQEEASAVVISIHKMSQMGLPLSKQAILLRSAIQARPFEEKLRFFEIPYTIVGGRSFFDRREIKDAIAFLRAMVFSEDDIALLRVLNVPKRGFGKAARETIDEISRTRRISVQEVLEDDECMSKVSSLGQKGGRKLMEALSRARKEMNHDGRKALEQLLEDVRYDSHLIEISNRDPLDLEARRSAVDGLLESLSRLEEKKGTGKIDRWIRDIALEPNTDDHEGGEVLTLMTFHGAKGLEFPVVYLVGVEEGLIPHRRAIAEDPEAGEEEERRLLYVAMTRAMDQLHLSMARTRRRVGRDMDCTESRFLLDIPEDLLKREEVREEDRPPVTGGEARNRLAKLREMLSEEESEPAQ
ncbi:MAG: UvrD-helicase domain-containing protein [Planctomycetia bacterium]|nr:UvrD-helicase domain-containing protein [Planctomycetia bacterium]